MFHYAVMLSLLLPFMVVLTAEAQQQPLDWNQVGPAINGKILVSGDADSGLSTQFGYSLAMSANGTILAVVEAYLDFYASLGFLGYVRVYQKDFDQTYKQIGPDTIDESRIDNFGVSIAMSSDGTTIAVGATDSEVNRTILSGRVDIYQQESNQMYKKVGTVNGTVYDGFGTALAISADGRTLVVGSPNYGKIGYARVFYKDFFNQTYYQIGSDINGELQGDQFGYSLALSADGSTIAIGAPGRNSGQFRIFQKELNQTYKQIGPAISGTSIDDSFGYSIAMSADGRNIAVGAPGNDRVRVYQKGNSQGYNQIGSDIISNAQNNARSFGRALAMSADGSIIAVGAALYGYVRVYQKDSSIQTYKQIGSDIKGSGLFGNSVALSADGQTIAVTAPNYGIPPNSTRGQVRVFAYSSPAPTSVITRRPSSPTQRPTRPTQRPTRPTQRPTRQPIAQTLAPVVPIQVPSTAPGRIPCGRRSFLRFLCFFRRLFGKSD